MRTGNWPLDRKLQRRIIGFTVVELLVVVAIILVLAAIVLPIYNRARVQAHVTDDIAKLKQLGAANAMYSAENDGRIQVGLEPFVGKLDPALFHSKLDPTRDGLWNTTARRWGYRGASFDQRVSFFSLWSMFSVYVDPNEFATLPGNPGWLIAFSPLEVYEASDSRSMFRGSFLRLTMEGSVIRRPPQKYGNATGYIWYFRDHTDQEKQATLDE